MSIRSPTLLVVALLVALPAMAGEGSNPSDAPEMSLVSAGSVIDLDEGARAELVAELTAFFESCHSHAAVVGEEPPQDQLRRLWMEQEQRTHAFLRMTGAADSRHTSLRRKRFAVLVGFESEKGPWPVLARGEDEALTMYTKCPGLKGLLLSCQVHALIPGVAPSADCERLKEIHRQVEEKP